MHIVNPLHLDATNDNVTSTSFFAGFTQNYADINSTAKATISSFVTGTVEDRLAPKPLSTKVDSRFAVK